MGKVLQIRVTASTYDPGDVARLWPGLCRLAWGEAAGPDQAVGVRELVARLNDLWKFGDQWSPDLRNTVGQRLPGLLDLDARLEAALADRQPGRADKLSYEIEDGLDHLEQALD